MEQISNIPGKSTVKVKLLLGGRWYVASVWKMTLQVEEIEVGKDEELPAWRFGDTVHVEGAWRFPKSSVLIDEPRELPNQRPSPIVQVSVSQAFGPD